MKILTLILAALFCLQMACAVPDSAVIGPFNVSFDTGFNNSYHEEQPWIETETLNGSRYETGSISVYTDIDNPESVALIIVEHYDKDQNFLSPSMTAEYIGKMLPVLLE